MAYKMKVNSCEGTFQGVYVGPNREITESAPWPSRDQAVEAIQFHHKEGKWPREVEEVPVEICNECGRPIPPPA